MINLKKDKRKIALIFVIAIILIILAILIIKNVNKKDNNSLNNSNSTIGDFVSEIDMTNTQNSKIREDGMKINNSDKISKGIEFNDLILTDIKIESTGDMASFNAKVKNTYGRDIEEYAIKLTFLRKDGTSIATIETVFPYIPNGETGVITATSPKDISTAYDIRVENSEM